MEDTNAKRPRSRDGDFSEIQSYSRSISPPRKKKRSPNQFASPWKLTWIRDLPEEDNKDAVTLKDLLGDPLISECWEFNYLHDIPFLMDAFDEDVRHLVQVHVVHGFWKREDENRLVLTEMAEQFPNVQLHVAPMPEMFGTHHSKMMILFRHDNTAQVIIHTANMIAKDWTNMTNGVWMSPLLPELNDTENIPAPETMAVGSGRKFKHDLMNYLRAYGLYRPTCKTLIEKLTRYDFKAVQGCLVASVPGRHDVDEEPDATRWGWHGLRSALQNIPCQQGGSEIVAQISSIATLGPKDSWLRGTLFSALSGAQNQTPKGSEPKFKVVFPTADEIRRSLDGYASGGSIHTKIQSRQQAQQLQYMRPIFYHWANDSSKGIAPASESTCLDGGRNRAAPHIKTYIRYNNNGTIDWGLLTSANLSKQAWGDSLQQAGAVRIASWEIGVLVWPGLYEADAAMVGSFRQDMPTRIPGAGDDKAIVGVRVPYSLPLQQYGTGEVPWVATMNHPEPDNKGVQWIVE